MGSFLAAILAVNNSFSLAYQELRLDYREPSDGVVASKNLDSEKGWLSKGGFRIAGSVMRDMGPVEKVWLSASFSREEGTVPYDGHAYFGPFIFPAKDTSYALVEDIRVAVGKGFVAGEQWLFTPHLAYGYHGWDRTLDYRGSSEYREDYRHHTAQAGVLSQWAPRRGTVLSLDASYGRTFAPHIRTQDDRVNAGLGRAEAVDLALEIDQALLAKGLHLFLGAGWSRFSYGASAVQNGYFEPSSRSRNQTWRAGLRYSFL